MFMGIDCTYVVAGGFLFVAIDLVKSPLAPESLLFVVSLCVVQVKDIGRSVQVAGDGPWSKDDLKDGILYFNCIFVFFCGFLFSDSRAWAVRGKSREILKV